MQTCSKIITISLNVVNRAMNNLKWHILKNCTLERAQDSPLGYKMTSTLLFVELDQTLLLDAVLVLVKRLSTTQLFFYSLFPQQKHENARSIA